MSVPPLPPIRMREADGSPNVIPVFEIIVTNGTLKNLGGGRVELATGGAGGGGGDPGQVAVGSPFYSSVGGAIVFAETDQTLAQDESQLFWDNANNRLGVGTSVPSVILDVVGTGRFTGQLVLTLDAASAGHAVRGNRTLATTAPVAGGGNLTADRTLTVDTAFLVHTGRVLTAVYPVQSGGSLAADRSFNVDTAFLVTSSRAINTTAPVLGGGNLGADRTLTVDTAFLVGSTRTLTAGSGLSGGGNLSADRTFSVNTNVRDKLLGFFVASTLTTTHRAEETRVYVPFNMEFRDIRLAITQTPVGANILVQLYQFPTAVGAGSAFFSSGSRPIIATGNAAGIGSGGGDFLNNTLYAGSYLGFAIDQIGTTSTGQDLTITTIWRTS